MRRSASRASRCGRCRRCRCDDATTLFVQRARATRPDFDPDPETAASVAEICRRLDGLPLAIELAAARMRMMSAAEVAQRLDDGRLLARGPRTAQPRHQSLAAAIDWSYRLLSQPRAAAVRAAVGVRGRRRPRRGARGVRRTGHDRSRHARPAHRAGRQVDGGRGEQSAAAPATGCWRRCVPTGGSGCAADGSRLARRHAEYFVELAERAARGVQGPDERMWVERTLPDADNLRVAFEQVIADQDADLAMRLVTSLPEVSAVCGSGTSRRPGPSGRSISRPPTTRCSSPPSAPPPAVRGTVGDFARARRLAARAGGRVPGPRHGPDPAIRRTSWRTSRCTRATSTPPCATTTPR